jgi:hypothetical protein
VLGDILGSVAAFFTMLFSYLYIWSFSTCEHFLSDILVSISDVLGVAPQATGRFNLSLPVDTLANLSRTSLARSFSAALATPLMKFILISIFLPTMVEGHNDGNKTVTNVDVYHWVKGAPKSVRENFRITFSNEVAFHPDLSQDFLFPRLTLPPWPFPRPCIRCHNQIDPLADPFGVYRWVRGAPIGILENFQIEIIMRNIFVDDPDGGAPNPPPPDDRGLPPGGLPEPKPNPPKGKIIGFALNEILIQRLWATSFRPIGR